MKFFINRIALFLFLFVMAVPTFADIPSPNKNTSKKQPKTNELKTNMDIVPDRNVREATLIIPRSMLQQLAMDTREDSSLNAASVNRFNLTQTQTIMFGLLLSLSVVFAGVWFLRSRISDKNISRIAVVIALMALCGAATTAVYANAGPPSIARSITSRILIPAAQSYGVWGEVKVQVSDDRNGITLKVPIPKEDKPQ